MTGGWQEFLGEAERILAGKKLLPFWRGDAKRGINLRRVFTEPRTLDLVLWIQGTAALPYLEAGEISTPEVWAPLRPPLPRRVRRLCTLVQLTREPAARSKNESARVRREFIVAAYFAACRHSK